VGLRRVQLDWGVIKGWLGLGRKQETTATMGALLKRKESVGSQLKTRSERHPGAGKPAAPPSYPLPGQSAGVRSSAPKPPSSPSKAGGQSPPSESTTSRLLDMKRKRQEGGEEKK